MAVYKGDVSSGNSIVNANKLGKKTKWIDVSSDVSLATTTEKYVQARFFCDSNNSWFMELLGGWTLSVADDDYSVTFSNITTKDMTGLSTQSYPHVIDAKKHNASITLAGFVSNGNSLRIKGTLAIAIASIYGVVPLESEPTTYTTSDNLESADVDVHIPEATATNAGVVKKSKWQKKTTSSNFTTDGDTLLTFNNVIEGKIYEIKFGVAKIGRWATDDYARVAVWNGSDKISINGIGLEAGGGSMVEPLEFLAGVSGSEIFVANSSGQVFLKLAKIGNAATGVYNGAWAYLIERADLDSQTTDFT